MLKTSKNKFEVLGDIRIVIYFAIKNMSTYTM